MQCMQRERPAAAIMTSLTIRRIDPAIKERLRVRAARHGRSMEEEARRILGEACVVETAPPRNAYEAIRRHFEALGGVELEPPPRGPAREPPAFD
jgi:plasmid stability protein